MFAYSEAEVKEWPLSMKNRALFEAVMRDDANATSLLLHMGADGSRTREWLGLEGSNLYEIAIGLGSAKALDALLKKEDPSVDYLALLRMGLRRGQGKCIETIEKNSRNISNELREEMAKELCAVNGKKETIALFCAGFSEETMTDLMRFSELLGRDEVAAFLKRGK